MSNSLGVMEIWETHAVKGMPGRSYDAGEIIRHEASIATVVGKSTRFNGNVEELFVRFHQFRCECPACRFTKLGFCEPFRCR